jgi:cytochrome c-type biogenesis protein CcsB
MKKSTPWIITVLVALTLGASIFRPERAGERHWRAFGQLPVLLNGRVKPLDTVARSTLLVLHDKQTLRLDDGEKMSAIQWLAEACFAPHDADHRQIFTIHDPDILGMFGWQQGKQKYFSFAELRPKFAAIDEQSRLARDVPTGEQSRFQRDILHLFRRLVMYQQLKNSLQPEDASDFAGEVAKLAEAAPGLARLAAVHQSGQTLSEGDRAALELVLNRYHEMGESASFLVVPPVEPGSGHARTEWLNMGNALVAGVTSGTLHPIIQPYADLGAAFRRHDDAQFNATLDRLHAWLAERYAPELRKSGHEVFFNRYEPFYQASIIYVLIFLLACSSWLTGPGTLRRSAYLLTGLALLVHTSGLVFRTYLQGYAPVTNLYSSAVFVGWAAVLLAFFLERIYRNAVASVVAGVIGFCTLLIAHHLMATSSSGDTMEMMQAVLDSNFWLATHVVAITIGYSTTFLAGCLGVAYILLGVCSKWLDKTFSTETAAALSALSRVAAVSAAESRARSETNGRAINRMVYAILCFATLFSFVGTVLGGIWADQSWGRFWGWDPKENGAALIVLWNAIVLHARWGGFIRERGLMVMAVFGNIVTAWSWFGVNLLSVGLHSYGFTEGAFFWLFAFWLSQLAIMALGGFLPLEKWRSGPKAAAPTQESGGAATAAAGR